MNYIKCNWLLIVLGVVWELLLLLWLSLSESNSAVLWLAAGPRRFVIALSANEKWRWSDWSSGVLLSVLTFRKISLTHSRTACLSQTLWTAFFGLLIVWVWFLNPLFLFYIFGSEAEQRGLTEEKISYVRITGSLFLLASHEGDVSVTLTQTGSGYEPRFIFLPVVTLMARVMFPPFLN